MPCCPVCCCQALNKGKAASSVEEVRAQIKADPTIVATAFKTRRFYLFSRRMPVSRPSTIRLGVILDRRREVLLTDSVSLCVLPMLRTTCRTSCRAVTC